MTQALDDCIGALLIERTQDDLEKNVTPQLLKYLKKPISRQLAIDQLINTRKNISGEAINNVIWLYNYLNLKEDSLKKFQSNVWYKKARGIYELYMMNQRDMLLKIFKRTNSQNEYIRMEAQIAIIGFSGFEGLVFLNTLTYSLTEWHQIKLLEQLSTFNQVHLEKLPKWLQSSNKSVVMFALKLADVYQQIFVHDEVTECLKDENEKIRLQAIKTLSRIAVDNTPQILQDQYDNEEYATKLEILRQLAIIGSEEDIPFLLEKLNESDDNLKLEATRAIMKCSSNGEEIVEKKIENDNIPVSILKQVKYEQVR
ncbi:MAG TPA: HEAT repeat domain-containing protein [Flavipsychrobacter sp.]|nr:HEAT repeat domain-containing protein [Flavipsychrobacter sp.]